MAAACLHFEPHVDSTSIPTPTVLPIPTTNLAPVEPAVPSRLTHAHRTHLKSPMGTSGSTSSPTSVFRTFPSHDSLAAKRRKNRRALAASKAPKGARPLLPRSLQIRRACAFNNPLGTAGSTRGLFNAPGGRPSGHPPIRPSGLRPPSFAKRTAGRHGLRPPRLGRRGAILAPTGGWKPPLLQNPKDWWINPIPSQGSLAGKLVAGKFPSTSPPTKTDPHAEPRRRGGSTQTRPHDVIYPPVAT